MKLKGQTGCPSACGSSGPSRRIRARLYKKSTTRCFFCSRISARRGGALFVFLGPPALERSESERGRRRIAKIVHFQIYLGKAIEADEEDGGRPISTKIPTTPIHSIFLPSVLARWWCAAPHITQKLTAQLLIFAALSRRHSRTRFQSNMFKNH